MEKEKKTYKVVSFLKREELDFLDNLEKDIYFGHGVHIPRTKLIEEIIEAFKDKGQLDRQALEQELLRMFSSIEKEESQKQGEPKDKPNTQKEEK